MTGATRILAVTAALAFFPASVTAAAPVEFVAGVSYPIEDVFGPHTVSAWQLAGGAQMEQRFEHRELQTSGGNLPDINATTNTCQGVGARIQCQLNTRIPLEDGNYTDLDFTLYCQLDSQVAFDFRRAQSCSCEVAVTSSHPDTPVKQCACASCPINWGDAPISLDCSANEADPFVTTNPNCTSLDCAGACNGTCALDCSNSGPECTFCANNPLAPTLAPSGQGGGGTGCDSTTAEGRAAGGCNDPLQGAFNGPDSSAAASAFVTVLVLAVGAFTLLLA